MLTVLARSATFVVGSLFAVCVILTGAVQTSNVEWEIFIAVILDALTYGLGFVRLRDGSCKMTAVLAAHNVMLCGQGI